jgi:16S rRNA (adenine1518-N6/adenine1519-N6)-dimethyltransferase
MENIRAKKSLGQNFLKSKVALEQMIKAGDIANTDLVVEIGPGKGALTEKLLSVAGRVIAFEKDSRLIGLLKEKFAAEIAERKLILIYEDALEITPEKFKLHTEKYKIIANIPYYITGQFLRKFLETSHQPERIIVMVQKEIAQRIMAKDKNGGEGGAESLLSISVKAYGKPRIVARVDKENFSPAPKVDSAILAIENISKKFFTENNISEEKFFELLHAGFAHKRKMLLGNLKAFFKKDFSEIFSSLNLSPKVRAEELDLTKWLQLVKGLK